ncbi:MAG: Fur family transcriptional regulator [Calditrichia bacterium]
MSEFNSLIEAMKSKGLSVTYQRLLIYKYLLNTQTHPSAEEIYQEIKSEYPSISMATVYKTLETLANHNLIAKVNVLHDLARFDGDTTPHHHLVCLNCKKIVDIYDNRLDDLPLPSNNGFRVTGYRVQYEGICEDCTTRAAVRIKKQRSGVNNSVTFCCKG